MIVTLQNAKHETEAEFESEMMDHLGEGMLPDIMTWNGRQYVFSTTDWKQAWYVQAFNFAIVEGVTATRIAA